MCSLSESKIDKKGILLALLAVAVIVLVVLAAGRLFYAADAESRVYAESVFREVCDIAGAEAKPAEEKLAGLQKFAPLLREYESGWCIQEIMDLRLDKVSRLGDSVEMSVGYRVHDFYSDGTDRTSGRRSATIKAIRTDDGWEITEVILPN